MGTAKERRSKKEKDKGAKKTKKDKKLKEERKAKDERKGREGREKRGVPKRGRKDSKESRVDSYGYSDYYSYGSDYGYSDYYSDSCSPSPRARRDKDRRRRRRDGGGHRPSHSRRRCRDREKRGGGRRGERSRSRGRGRGASPGRPGAGGGPPPRRPSPNRRLQQLGFSGTGDHKADLEEFISKNQLDSRTVAALESLGESCQKKVMGTDGGENSYVLIGKVNNPDAVVMSRIRRNSTR